MISIGHVRDFDDFEFPFGDSIDDSMDMEIPGELENLQIGIWDEDMSLFLFFPIGIRGIDTYDLPTFRLCPVVYLSPIVQWDLDNDGCENGD